MSAELNKLSEEAQSLARIPLFKRLEPHEREHLAEDVVQVNYAAGQGYFVHIFVHDPDAHRTGFDDVKSVAQIMFVKDGLAGCVVNLDDVFGEVFQLVRFQPLEEGNSRQALRSEERRVGKECR